MRDAPAAASAWIARARPVRADSRAVVIEVLRGAGAAQVLDLGCGEGQMAADLIAAGFKVTGVDPLEAAVQKAGLRAPLGRFICARAEALPADLGLFDAVVIINALHHVPPASMLAALSGALAVLRPGGPLLVVEPLPAGSFSRAMRPVEDETAVRLQAIAAVERLIASGQAELRDLRRWDRESRFSTLEDFGSYLLRADPARAAALRDNAAALARAWRANIELRDGAAMLVQPHICWTLAARQPCE